MSYEIRDGRVVTRSLEAHVTDHCNLRCRQCCSLSPFLPTWNVTPERLREDLRLAARVLHPLYFKIVGGEPLLHPRLIELLGVARESSLAGMVAVTTNGLLLPKMPDDFWRQVDQITVSLYPQPALPDGHLEAIVDRASWFGVAVNFKSQDEFEEVTLTEPMSDDAETLRVYQACWMKERCHMIRDGWFYMCTRPPHFHTFFQGKPAFGEVDGVELHDGEGLVREIQRYLERKEPLESCRRCLGNTGAKHPHRQLTRAEVAARTEGEP